ncbi:MAG: hypothetical protein IJ207_04575 [Treponema sp.]|uniref:hypothetical protein n=1 Tax=Treponema sp. TaxID=166 RepID=UPI0025F2721D|nr:hypothetical protein [Treponema sp.]MBQ9281456.1 hypothetical protein [Treponema sp.]
MTISDDGYPMYFVPNAKIDEKDLRMITEDDIQKVKLTEELKRDLSFCNLGLESLVGLYCDKNGYIITKIDSQYYMFKVRVKELKNKRNNSRSDVQQEIEKKQLEKLKAKLNIIDFEENPTLFLSDNKIKIEPDFYSEDKKIIGEIHTHLGKLKGSQPDKIASDILKMVLFEKDKQTVFQKIIVVCSEEEYKQLQGNSFLAEAIRQFKIRLCFFELTEEEKKELKKTIDKQDLSK